MTLLYTNENDWVTVDAPRPCNVISEDMSNDNWGAEPVSLSFEVKLDKEQRTKIKKLFNSRLPRKTKKRVKNELTRYFNMLDDNTKMVIVPFGLTNFMIKVKKKIHKKS